MPGDETGRGLSQTQRLMGGLAALSIFVCTLLQMKFLRYRCFGTIQMRVRRFKKDISRHKQSRFETINLWLAVVSTRQEESIARRPQNIGPGTQTQLPKGNLNGLVTMLVHVDDRIRRLCFIFLRGHGKELPWTVSEVL